MRVTPETPAVPEVSLAKKVAFLSRAESYPHRPARVDLVQTHMSWVFLAGEHVYKLKKPVRHAFLDFSTLVARQRDCLEEVRLNRRLAPDVYLCVVALTSRDGRSLALGGSGAPVEWLVHMRRLPRSLMLDQAIEDGTVSVADVERLARVLADFYRAAPPVPVGARDYRDRFARDIRANHRVLGDPRYGLPGALLEQITGAQQAFIDDEAHALERRAEERRIVEAHGDLRPEHVCLAEVPVIIDCLEFNREFRTLDPVDELAYLAMECENLGAPFVGETVFAVYSAGTGDVPESRLVDFYKAYRASLRARLAVWHLEDHDARERDRWIGRAERYLALAARF